MPRVSDEHLTARREQILEAARVCFLRNGLHNTSMQDLIREADLSVGAVYRYFKSKNEIIGAIAASVAGTLSVYVEELARRTPRLPIGEVMSLVLDVLDVQIGPNGNFPIALQVWAEATRDPAIAEIVRDRYESTRSAFTVIAEMAVDAGELPPDTDVAAVGSALFGMVPGYALQRLLVGYPDKETYLRGIRTLLNRTR